MPSRPCKHPTCTRYVPMNFTTRYCAEHQGDAREDRRERDQSYDRYARDPEAKRFYNSAAWCGPHGARLAMLALFPICQRCNRAWGEHVHHRVPLDRCTIEQRTDPENLMVVCPPCHNTIEAEAAA